MPPIDRYGPAQDDERDEMMAAFEAFDDGLLTAANAHEFELPKKDGAVDGDVPKEGGEADGEAKKGSQPADASKDNETRVSDRDQRGRFTKAADEAGQKPADSVEQKATTPPQAQAQQPAAEKPPAAQHEATPDGLGAKAGQLWANASPEVRDYIRETEGVIANVRGQITPLFEEAKTHNLQWGEYAKRLVNADRYIRRSPMDALLWLAETHGIDTDALADMAAAKRAGAPFSGGQTTQNQNPNFNAALQPLQQQLQQVAGRLDAREQQEQQARQAEANARQAAVKAEMDAFIGDKAKAPHWDAVKDQALALIPAIYKQTPGASVTEIVKSAYDQACWANPTVRTQLQSGQSRQQQDQQRARRAVAAAGQTSHRSGPPVRQPAQAANGFGSNDLQAEIAANWDAYEANR